MVPVQGRLRAGALTVVVNCDVMGEMVSMLAMSLLHCDRCTRVMNVYVQILQVT